MRLSQPDDVQRDVHGSPMQISLRIRLGVERPLAPQQTQEERLKHVFSVFGVTGNAVCSPVNQVVVFSKRPLEVLGEWPAVRSLDSSRHSLLIYKTTRRTGVLTHI